MAISFHPASSIARAYARPKVIPARTDVNQKLAPAQNAADNRREAPAVRIRLSSEALAILAQGRKDTPHQTVKTPDPKPASETENSEFFPEDIFASEPRFENGSLQETPEKANATQLEPYAPPGSKINILL